MCRIFLSTTTREDALGTASEYTCSITNCGCNGPFSNLICISPNGKNKIDSGAYNELQHLLAHRIRQALKSHIIFI